MMVHCSMTLADDIDIKPQLCEDELQHRLTNLLKSKCFFYILICMDEL